jgi:hypothetical protein
VATAEVALVVMVAVMVGERGLEKADRRIGMVDAKLKLHRRASMSVLRNDVEKSVLRNDVEPQRIHDERVDLSLVVTPSPSCSARLPVCQSCRHLKLCQTTVSVKWTSASANIRPLFDNAPSSSYLVLALVWSRKIAFSTGFILQL